MPTSPSPSLNQSEVDRAGAHQQLMSSVAEGVSSAPAPRVALTIADFCYRNQMSLGTFHKLQRAGVGPAVMRVDNWCRITLEAEMEWQRMLSNPQGAEAKVKAAAVAKAKARGRYAGALSAASPLHVSKGGKRGKRTKRVSA